MRTVEQIIRLSLTKIQALGLYCPVEAEQGALFIDNMNDFMLGLDQDGVALGYTEVSSLSDNITISSGLMGALVANMAVISAPHYFFTIPVNMQILADKGLTKLIRAGTTRSATQYPSTLPRGSGHSSTFYPPSDSEVESESGGSISLESGTND